MDQTGQRNVMENQRRLQQGQTLLGLTHQYLVIGQTSSVFAECIRSVSLVLKEKDNNMRTGSGTEQGYV